MRAIDRACRALSVAGAGALLLVSAFQGAAAETEAGFDLQAALTEYVGLVPAGAVAVTVHDGEVTAAAAGIVDDRGDPVTPDSSFLIGNVLAPMDAVIVLQLVEEGRLRLEDPVVELLPQAPVAPEATVLDLLHMRTGLPNQYYEIAELSLAEPSHAWELDELVGLIDADSAESVGIRVPSVSNTFVLHQLIEAVEGGDYTEVMRSRIAEPLGLESFDRITGDGPAPPGLVSGWNLDLGLVGDPEAEVRALTTIDGRIGSAVDVAEFARALMDGELVSDESLAMMLDEGGPLGFDRHELVFGDLGDLGARYFSMGGSFLVGHWVTLSIDPASGDIIVVMTSSIDLFAPNLVRHIATSWAPEDT